MFKARGLAINSMRWWCSIDLPDETFAGLDRESAELAAELRAAAAANVSRSEFISVLSRLQVSPMQENAEEALAGARQLLL